MTLRKKYTEAEAQTMGEMPWEWPSGLELKTDQDLLGRDFYDIGDWQ